MATALEFVKLLVAKEQEARFLRDRPAAIDSIREACPGFRSASLYRGEEPGVWFDVVLWDSLEAAKQAASEATQLPPVATWLAHIQEVTQVEHGVLAEDQSTRM